MKSKPPAQGSPYKISYSGPLPPASEFAAYDKALPGTAERLLDMVEKQADHRRKLDEKVLDKSVKLSSTGQIFSFVTSTLALGAICLSIVFAQPIVAIVPAVILIPNILSVLLNRKK